jgi:hypothetical protein
MPEPEMLPPDPLIGDPGGYDEDFLAAAKAWAADPTNGTKKSTMVAALEVDQTETFIATGVYVALHQEDGTDARWATCPSEADATYTAVALNAWLVGHARP